MVLTVPPAASAGLSRTGPVRVNVATGCWLARRLAASCGWTLPLTLMAVSWMRSVALVTSAPDSTIVPVTPVVVPPM